VATGHGFVTRVTLMWVEVERGERTVGGVGIDEQHRDAGACGKPRPS